jgi:hypothetical protein
MFIIYACKPKHNQSELDAFFEGMLMKCNRELTNIIISDIFTPPVASRIYAYSNIAAYEGIRFANPAQRSLTGQLNGLYTLSKPEVNKTYYYPLTSMVAFTTVAQSLVFNLEEAEAIKDKILKEVVRIGIDSEVYSNSVELGELLAKEILIWAQQDGYLRRTALPRYTVINSAPGRWRPTPPNYMEAIEPHWNTLRPFVLDSASQFDPGFPTPFAIAEKSPFYMQAMEVYELGLRLEDEHLEIAKFWDCNPNISFTNGHVMYFQQKISPGGHWIHITAQTLEAKRVSSVKAAATMAEVSIAIADAFISCWDQKYKSNLIRPETYINTYIDPEWKPMLQTPAFPEHTSGHSVASNAAATVLTHIFGDNYSYSDTTEVRFGLPTRHFQSFMQAAQEASISRMYGGIHFRPAIEMGMEQGKAVGNHVLKKIELE